MSTVIRIREKANGAATVDFDRGPEHGIRVSDPFSAGEEAELAWYFEEHLRFPFTGQVRAGKAAASVRRYGEKLFRQVFESNHKVYAQYSQARTDNLRLEIAGSPEFHRLHWEALWDPSHAVPLSHQAVVVRQNLRPVERDFKTEAAPVVRLLLVVSRPEGRNDIAYRTISRPLVEELGRSGLRVQADIVRPGTWEALEKHLGDHPSGYYHLLHFDGHGKLVAAADLEAACKADKILYEGLAGAADAQERRACLFFEGDQPGKPHAIDAEQLAGLLNTYQIPVVILNACQSGMQVGERETSLAGRLALAGVQCALGMDYSITVTAAALLMRTLYEELFQGRPVELALRAGRRGLFSDKQRRAYFNQRVELEDWLLPVLHENRPVRLAPREMTEEEQRAWLRKKAAAFPFPEPTYGFFGRDLDVQEVEQRVLRDLRSNVLLIEGLGGAGKTTLLRHLAAWWQTTDFVDRVFYFGYDETAWRRQQILTRIGQALLRPADGGVFQTLPEPEQQERIAEVLRAERHLLILDNLESITGEQLAIRNVLPPEDREALRRFLARLRGGRTLVLLGSRGGEKWLAPGTFERNVYELRGLDPEAASDMAERILKTEAGAARFELAQNDPEFAHLLKILDGFPLALQVVLRNLNEQSPAQVVQALLAGEPGLDQKGAMSKTESIVRCIEYSHSNLSAEAQALLECLAPFTGVIFGPLLPKYVERLQKEPSLAELPWDRMGTVLQEAERWGLLRPEEGGFLRLQPILPYFLRQRLEAAEAGERKRSIHGAFREHYDGVAGAIRRLQESKDPDQKLAGQAMAEREFENLYTALRLSLAARVSILNPYAALSGYLDSRQDQRGGLALGEKVLTELEAYPPEVLRGAVGIELAGVIDNIGKRLLLLKQLERAEAACRRALEILSASESLPTDTLRKLSANSYHQLGIVAQQQRQWEQAEAHYRQALEILVEFHDDWKTAITVGNLSRLWKATDSPTIPARVAEILKISREKAEERLRAAAPE
jgi:tetratricopeptide (TPR) repeat protein